MPHLEKRRVRPITIYIGGTYEVQHGNKSRIVKAMQGTTGGWLVEDTESRTAYVVPTYLFVRKISTGDTQ